MTVSVKDIAVQADGVRVSRFLIGLMMLILGTSQASTLDTASSQVASAYSPDSKRVVTIMANNAIAVWVSDSGEQLKLFRGHEGPVNSVVFSPNGSRILTASDDGTARIWALSNGDLLQVLSGHEGAVQSAEYSQLGNRILTIGADGTARVWFADNGELLDTLKVQAGVSRAQISPDGSRVVTTDQTGGISSWDEYSRKLVVVTLDAGLSTAESSSALKSLALQDLEGSPATSSPERTSLLDTVSRWSEAWTAQDFERYIALYDRDFEPEGGVVRKLWQSERRMRLEQPEFIKVTISEAVPKLITPTEATVTFTQQHRSDRYSDTCLKQLDLVSRNGAWLILREKSLKCE